MKAKLAIGYTFHDLAFSYDPVGKLTSLENKAAPSSTGSHNTPTASNTYTFSQSYDTIHNITRKTQSAAFIYA